MPRVLLFSAFILLATGVHARSADKPPLPLGYTCEQVRSFVAQYGYAKALAMALENGATWRQVNEARRCLK